MNEEKKITAEEFDKAVVKVAAEMVKDLEKEDSAASTIMVMTGMVFASQMRQELF